MAPRGGNRGPASEVQAQVHTGPSARKPGGTSPESVNSLAGNLPSQVGRFAQLGRRWPR